MDQEKIQRAISMLNKPNPTLKTLELLDREMERLHGTIRIKIENRENTYTEENVLKDLRTKWEIKLGEYSDQATADVLKVEDSAANF